MASGADPAAGLRSTLLIPFVLVCAVLAERAQVIVSTGGRGALPLLVIVAPLAAVVTVVRYGTRRSLGFLANPVFVLAVLPYLALTALLPVLGVMFNGYAERTLLYITEATTAFSFLILGAAASSSGERSWSPWLLLAIALQLIYAAGQAVYLSRGPGWELFAPFHEWDLSLADLNNTFAQARSSGLYLNPNELGLWAGFAVILGWTMLSPRLRGTGLTLAILTLLLSQSRGAAVGLAAALIVGAALSVARGRLSPGAFKAVLSIGFAGLLAIFAAFVVTPPGALGDRFGALFQVLTVGPRADANLAGRLDYWSNVMVLNSLYPWGTWGPPNVLLGTAVDSSWFRAFAQGSVLYVASLVLLIVASLFVGESRHRHALRLVSVLVAVAGVTQTPFAYPVIALFWVLLGDGLQSSIVGRVSAQPIPWKPARTARAGASGRLR